MNLETTSTPTKNLNGAAMSPVSSIESKSSSAGLKSEIGTDLYHAFREQSSELAGRVIQFVRKNPAISAAAAISVGLFVARLLSHNGSKSKKAHEM